MTMSDKRATITFTDPEVIAIFDRRAQSLRTMLEKLPAELAKIANAKELATKYSDSLYIKGISEFSIEKIKEKLQMVNSSSNPERLILFYEFYRDESELWGEEQCSPASDLSYFAIIGDRFFYKSKDGFDEIEENDTLVEMIRISHEEYTISFTDQFRHAGDEEPLLVSTTDKLLCEYIYNAIKKSVALARKTNKTL